MVTGPRSVAPIGAGVKETIALLWATMRTIRWLLFLALASCGSEESAREPAPETAQPSAPAEQEAHASTEPPPEVESPYEEGVDAQAQIDAAVAQARADGKRVLLVFGANWCVWCRRLEHVLRNETRVAAALRERWHVVHVDTGTRGSGTNRAVIDRYGDPVQHGLPCLVVLDGQGTLVQTQETGSLENGDRHDPERVLAFLQR